MPYSLNMKIFEEYLQVYGLIESKGKYFQKYIRRDYPHKITREGMDDIMLAINSGKVESYEGRVRSAIEFHNKINDNFEIYGKKKNKGCIFINKKSTEEEQVNLKKDSIYKTFLMSYLSILSDKGSVKMNMLRAWEEQEFPLAFLTFVDVAIQDKMLIRFDYFSDRKQELSMVEKFVPIKLNFQDKYWFLIGRNLEENIWIQYLVSGIRNVAPIVGENGKYEKCKNLDPIELKKFYEHTFGSARLNFENAVTITLKIPKGYKDAISKRHDGVGKWIDDETWEITTSAPNEVIDFVFKWSGHIQIISPDDVIKQFKKKLRIFQEQYKKSKSKEEKK